MASRYRSEGVAMPLKLKSWRKKKTKSEDGDSVSIASGSSFRSQEGRASWWSVEVEPAGGRWSIEF